MFEISCNRIFRTAQKHWSLSTDSSNVKLQMLDPESRSSLETDVSICCHCGLVKNGSQRTTLRAFLNHALIIILIVVALVASSGGLRFPRHCLSESSIKDHLKATSNYSPLFDALDMRLENRVFNGSLFSRNTSGLFRQPPSPEVDAAWKRISETPPFMVDREAIQKIGKDPSLVVKVPASWGEGEKYLVQLEAHHQMHCLNELRQQAYADYYYPGGPDHPLHWIHIAHCLDILRQVIMCSASVDLITYNWVETQKGGFPDFSVAHQCRDFEATMGWAQEQKRAIRLDERLDDLLDPPADAIVLPMEEEYYEYVPALSRYSREHSPKDGHHRNHDH